MRRQMLEAVLAARAARRGCVVATRLSDGAQRLFGEEASEAAVKDADPLAAAAYAALGADRSAVTEIAGERWFLHAHLPRPRLILAGAVHIAQCLAAMAAVIGVEVVVCDPRARYATAERFPGASLRHDWPDAAVRAEAPDRSCAVVALSHDPKLDDPALIAALESPCLYIGALGSRRSHAARLARLEQAGVPASARGRILGPVGLDIGAIGAGEIAASILAEWIAVRRGAPVRARPASLA